MHQSWMLCIQSKYVFAPVLGHERTRPSSTAAIAGSASGLMRTYHWSVSIGSTTTPLRSPRGIIDVCSVDRVEQALRLEVGDDALARDEAVEAAIRAAARCR